MRIPNTLRFRIFDLYMGLICFYPITTTLIDGTIINKLLFVSLIALQICMYWMGRMKRKTVILLLWLVVQYLFVLYHTEFPLLNANLLFYYPFFLMYTYFMTDNADRVRTWLAEQKGYMYTIVVLWSVIAGVSIFVPSCYYVKEGGASYFGSWAGDIFRLGPAVMFVQILVIVLQVMHKQKYALAYMMIPMYCVLMGSSRTYLVIGVLLFAVSWYISCRKKLHFWLAVIPAMVLLLILIMNSSMGEKILYTLDASQYGDFWFRITSARSSFWKVFLDAWVQLPWINKVLGCDINLTNRLADKWAHNDFIELLCSFGIVGVIQYTSTMVGMMKANWKNLKLPWILGTATVTIWLFNAFFNMHYVYFCAMLSFPLLVFAVRRACLDKE